MGVASAAEAQVRVIGHLLDIADRRGPLIAALTTATAAAVTELDPLHERDTVATWWRDLPPWARLDSFDRLRRGCDQIIVAEVQASAVAQDLRGLLDRRQPGTAERPLGLDPWQALDQLAVIAANRDTALGEMARAERGVHSRLTALCSAELRRQVRALQREEAEATLNRRHLAAMRSQPIGPRPHAAAG
ncbi:MAG TPA: hypothetical protein VFP61_11755 [Acidimicrobiales bacterium]|nr:hypothetical protein [Acidimicrobiales bacterium]